MNSTHFTPTRIYTRAEGSTLVSALTTSWDDGDDFAVENVADFDPGGGSFCIVTHDRSTVEEGTYEGVNENTDELTGVVRPDPANWPEDSIVESGGDGEANLLWYAEGYEDTESNRVVDVEIAPSVQRYFRRGPIPPEERFIVEASLDEADNIDRIIGPPSTTTGVKPRIQGGVSGGGRTEIDDDGFRAYDSSEQLTFNVESATGDVSMTGALLVGGTIRTAPPANGETRIEIEDSAIDSIKWLHHSGGADVTITRLRVDDDFTYLLSTRDVAITSQPSGGGGGAVAIWTSGSSFPGSIPAGVGFLVQTHTGEDIQLLTGASGDIEVTAGDEIQLTSAKLGFFGNAPVTQRTDPGDHVNLSGTDSDGTARTKINEILDVLRDYGLI